MFHLLFHGVIFCSVCSSSSGFPAVMLLESQSTFLEKKLIIHFDDAHADQVTTVVFVPEDAVQKGVHKAQQMSRGSTVSKEHR